MRHGLYTGSRHPERHLVSRIGWLRAAVLGANDGIVSTASLVVGVASAGPDRHAILLAGISSLLAGAMSMAAGEFVSVSSQADTERADLARETWELHNEPEAELEELIGIYEGRGLTHDLARQVAEQMMAKDPLAAHARDELGIVSHLEARPVQAAFTSAATFSAGAAIPMAATFLAPINLIVAAVFATSLLALAVLGAVGARAGGAHIGKPVVRVTFWGALAMIVTIGVGTLFGTVAG